MNFTLHGIFYCLFKKKFRCGHCKQLAPEYSKAALALKDSVPLAKVDATIHKELGKRFDIKGYPTIRFFNDKMNEPIDYDGERESEG